MIFQDKEYLLHFHNMVMAGFICGLKFPGEYIESYSRCIGLPYESMQGVTDFIGLFLERDWFPATFQREPKSGDEVVEEWNKYIDKEVSKAKKEKKKWQRLKKEKRNED